MRGLSLLEWVVDAESRAGRRLCRSAALAIIAGMFLPGRNAGVTFAVVTKGAVAALLAVVALGELYLSARGYVTTYRSTRTSHSPRVSPLRFFRVVRHARAANIPPNRLTEIWTRDWLLVRTKWLLPALIAALLILGACLVFIVGVALGWSTFWWGSAAALVFILGIERWVSTANLRYQDYHWSEAFLLIAPKDEEIEVAGQERAQSILRRQEQHGEPFALYLRNFDLEARAFQSSITGGPAVWHPTTPNTIAERLAKSLAGKISLVGIRNTTVDRSPFEGIPTLSCSDETWKAVVHDLIRHSAFVVLDVERMTLGVSIEIRLLIDARAQAKTVVVLEDQTNDEEFDGLEAVMGDTVVRAPLTDESAESLLSFRRVVHQSDIRFDDLTSQPQFADLLPSAQPSRAVDTPADDAIPSELRDEADSLQRAIEAGDPSAIAQLSFALKQQGNTALAREWAKEAIARVTPEHGPGLEAKLYGNLGEVLYDAGQLDEANRASLRASELYDEAKDYKGAALTATDLARLRLSGGVGGDFAHWIARAADFAKASNDPETLARTFGKIGELHLASGDLQQAATAYDAARPYLDAVTDREDRARSFIAAGESLRRVERWADAEALLRTGVAMARNLGLVREFTIAGLGLADILIAQEEPLRAETIMAQLVQTDVEPALTRQVADKYMVIGSMLQTSGAPEVGRAASSNALEYLERRGQGALAAEWRERLRALETPNPESADLAALLRDANDAFAQGRTSDGEQLSQRILSESRRRGAKLENAIAAHNMALRQMQSGHATPETLELMQEAAHLNRELGRSEALANTLTTLGTLQVDSGHAEAARSTWAEARGIFERAHDRAGIVKVLVNAATIAPDWPEQYRAARQLADELGSADLQGRVAMAWASMLANHGQPERASDMFKEASSLLQRGGDLAAATYAASLAARMTETTSV
jgi:tetratricopeptide (TPR) repeat protein